MRAGAAAKSCRNVLVCYSRRINVGGSSGFYKSKSRTSYTKYQKAVKDTGYQLSLKFVTGWHVKIKERIPLTVKQKDKLE